MTRVDLAGAFGADALPLEFAGLRSKLETSIYHCDADVAVGSQALPGGLDLEPAMRIVVMADAGGSPAR